MSNIIRFSIGEKTNIQSSTWRVWKEKDELYILVREMKRWIKISLHKSGQCHIKSLTNLEKNTAGDYYLHKWYLPSLNKTRQIIETFRITVPTNCVHKPMNKNLSLEDTQEITWIESNKPESVCVLFITTNLNVDENFIKRIYPAYSILKSFVMSNRNIYILFLKENVNLNFIQEVINYTDKLNINYSKKPEENEKYATMLELYKNNVPEFLNVIPGENSIRY